MAGRYFLCLLLIFPCPAWSQETTDTQNKIKNDFELLELFADTLDQVERNYVQEVNRRELMEAAIRGMMTKLDPYSNYIPPEEIDRFRTGVDNEFGGVGIQVLIENEELVVTSPIYNTPAYKAGIFAGDIIVSIEGWNTHGATVDEAVRKMKGKIGTPVELVVRRPNGKDEKITLKRETIAVETVLGSFRNPDHTWNYWQNSDEKIAYIRLLSFGRHTAGDLKQALELLHTAGIKALILDLRNNPGGLLSSAIEISDMFVAQGKIVSTAGRNIPEQVWDAHKPSHAETIPLAVLVNGYSASASEIVAACLQDHERAVVIGERTWGKGSVQNIIELESGKSALKLTTAGYKRPSGKNIHRLEGAKDEDEWGVRPNADCEVELDDDVLRRIFKMRQIRDAIHRPGEPVKQPETPEMPDEDTQLQKAISVLMGKLGKPVASPPPQPAAG